MSRIVSERIAEEIRLRAHGLCEYCKLPDALTNIDFEIDHVIARSHRGSDEFGNLAWACFRCNQFKGTNLSSVDPQTGRITILFNPRKNNWVKHFTMRRGVIHPLTSKGRATLALLQMNGGGYASVRREYFSVNPLSLR
jgi:hypothetical protein